MLSNLVLRAALIASLGTAGCSAAENAPSVTIDGRVMSITGQMDFVMVRLLRQQRWNAVRTTRFSSTGGWPDAGLQIAKILASTGRPIVLHRLCASACLDVLVIRNRITIEPGTLVLLHNTPMGQALTTSAYPHISRYLAAMGRREEKWLKKNGVDPRLALLAEGAIAPVCVKSADDDPAKIDRLLTLTRFDAWAPRSSTLTKLGVRTGSSWQQDTVSVLRIMHTNFPKANLARLRPADEPETLPTEAALTAALGHVGTCGGAGS